MVSPLTVKKRYVAPVVIVLLLATLPTMANLYREKRAELLIRNSLAKIERRGRLFGISTEKPDGETRPDLATAQRFLVGLPQSSQRQILQAYIHVCTQRWVRAAHMLEAQALLHPDNPVLANDLGVIYLELASDDVLYLIRALSQFQIAKQITPQSSEPKLNLVLAYRQLEPPRVFRRRF